MSRKNKRHNTIDSTRGNSPVKDPRNYKGDAYVQVWMDSRVLATLSEWLDAEGRYTRFMSEVVKIPMGILVDYLVESGEINKVDDTGDARELLQRKYRVNLNPYDRGRKNEQHNMLLSSIRSRGKKLSARKDEVDDINKLVRDDNNLYDAASDPEMQDRLARGTDIVNENYAKKQADDAREQSRQVVESFGTDENGIVQVPTHGRGDYTEADKIKDDEEKERREKIKTLKQCESIKEEGEKKVRESVKANDDRMASMSQEELDRREEERKARDKAERDAFDSVDVGDLSPVELDD